MYPRNQASTRTMSAAITNIATYFYCIRIGPYSTQERFLIPTTCTIPDPGWLVYYNEQHSRCSDGQSARSGIGTALVYVRDVSRPKTRVFNQSIDTIIRLRVLSITKCVGDGVQRACESSGCNAQPTFRGE